MADDSNRIGGSPLSSLGLGQVRKVSGIGAAAAGNTGSASVDGGAPAPLGRGSFGPRGNRMLPAGFPLDQLDRRAARGTYLDILV